jgi:hypothetical protein
VKQAYVHRFRRDADGAAVDTITAFIASREFEEGGIAGELEREVDVRLVPDELVLVCRESIADQLAHAFKTSGPLRRLRERLLPDTPTTLISFDETGTEVRRQVLSDLDAPSDVLLDDLLRRGATAIFRVNGGFVEATSAYHFRNPSGRHTSRFMRLSNILVRQAEITLLGVCALQHILPHIRRIYVDTPSLFAIVAAVNDVRESEAGLPPISADSFRSYHHVRSYQHFNTEDAVAMVSASSSGGLAKLLVERGFDASAIVHLLFLGDKSKDVTVAVDLHKDNRNPEGLDYTHEGNGDGDCSLCDTGSLPITLEGDQFDIAGPQPEPLVITRTNAHQALRELMDRHAGTHTFRVNGGRPVRQYAVDPDMVGGTGEAFERLAYLAAARIPGRLGHCIATNEASRNFARRVLTAAGSTVTILLPDEFDKAVLAAKKPFEDPILVATAVVGGGRQLLDISRRLRSCPKAPIIYFAGIVTTPSAERTKVLTSSLTLTSNPASHPLVILDEINLPAADAPNAWAAELSMLDELANAGFALTPELTSRQTRLRRTSAALEDELFVANATTTTLKLQPGFAFWSDELTAGTYTQADVFYTISAILQTLRTTEGGIGKKTLRTEWFYRTLLSPENFGRFNDAIIQACLLRAARPSELDYTDNRLASADASRLIRRIVESATTARGDAAAEFLLAMAMGRLRLRREDVGTVIDTLPPQTALVDQLADICRMRIL